MTYADLSGSGSDSGAAGGSGGTWNWRPSILSAEEFELAAQNAWNLETPFPSMLDSSISTTIPASSAEATAGEEEDLKSITSWVERQQVLSTRRASVVNAILTSDTLEKNIKEYSMRLSGFSMRAVINLLKRIWNFLDGMVRRLSANGQ